MIARLMLRCVAIGYLTLLILAPVAMILWQTFGRGSGRSVTAITQPDAVHALR